MERWISIEQVGLGLLRNKLRFVADWLRFDDAVRLIECWGGEYFCGWWKKKSLNRHWLIFQPYKMSHHFCFWSCWKASSYVRFLFSKVLSLWSCSARRQEIRINSLITRYSTPKQFFTRCTKKLRDRAIPWCLQQRWAKHFHIQYILRLGSSEYILITPASKSEWIPRAILTLGVWIS